MAAAQTLEQAFEATPALRRPKPAMDALCGARPELKSIVTHPPETGGPRESSGGMTAV